MTEDYFALFGLERKLVIDEAALQGKFYELSRQHHPDRFATRPPAEQHYALDFTALLNDGYRVLRDPVKRAEYLLKQEGLDVSKDVPPELLEEVFDLNMMLESAPCRPDLEAARGRFHTLQVQADAELQNLFRQFDEGGGSEALKAMRGVLNRRRYIQNLVRDVEKSLA